MRFSGWDRVATFACGAQLVSLPWEFTPSVPGMYATLCNYEPAFGSWVSCIDQVLEVYTPPEKLNKTFADSAQWADLVCTKAGGNLVKVNEEKLRLSLQNATNFYSDVPVDGKKLHNPVKVDYRTFRHKLKAVRAEFMNLDNSNDSVTWIYWYFALLLLVLILLQHTRLREFALKQPPINNLRGRFEIPTIVGSEKHAQHGSMLVLGGLLPTSIEALLIAGFMVVHTCSLVLNYSVDRREIMEPVHLQRLQALGNRSGIVSFGLLPLTLALSSRSVLLPYLTGMKYTTFLTLHRWLGRVLVFDAIIHSYAFYLHEIFTGELEKVRNAKWWILGIAATQICIVITILAIGAIRSRWYETFLYTHIALAIVFLYLCWAHVKSFGWTYWIFWSCLIWGLERLNRIRLLMKNGICEAEVTVVSPEILVLLTPKPESWVSHPTQYAFVHFILPGFWWQSHPFTVTETSKGELKIVISVKEGVTQALQRSVMPEVDPNSFKPFRLKVLLEGPYGESPELSSFDQVLAIGGGSGIPGPLAVSESLPKESAWNGNISFIAVARNLDIFGAYQDQLNQISRLPCVNMSLFYTGRGNDSSMNWDIKRSRPDMRAIIQDTLEKTTSLAVVCCGPPGLNDVVRNEVAAALVSFPSAKIEYFEEYQIW